MLDVAREVGCVCELQLLDTFENPLALVHSDPLILFVDGVDGRLTADWTLRLVRVGDPPLFEAPLMEDVAAVESD